MHLLSLLILTSSLLTVILSHPLALRQSDAVQPPFYLLRTITTAPKSEKSNLYVSAYHTGAGLNDAVLTPNIARASKGFLNDTYQAFDFETDFPWGMMMAGNANYAGEFTCSITTGIRLVKVDSGLELVRCKLI
jgi:hypothetical protein